MKRRGVTLIELLAALALTGIIVAALTVVFKGALNFVTSNPETIAAREEVRAQDEKIERFLAQTYLTPDATDSKCFFVASSQSGATSGNDTLTFTTVGVRPDGRALTPNEDDTFEDLNNLIGTQGGISEVSFSVQPVGEPTTQTEGLYMRVQRPADGDPTQGGKETLLVPGITTVLFEFWNGTGWVETWDTRSGDRRIPSLVKVTLGTATNQNETVLTVPLQYSDVTTTNPSAQGAAS